MPETAANLADWIGRETMDNDVVVPAQVRGLRATLISDDSIPAAGEASPLLMHWCCFLPYAPQNQIGPDGHPKRGGFMPPVALPRRMWAGSRIEFVRPLRVGAAITRRTLIGDVQEKSGRSGALVFVRLDHEISDDQGLVITEQHDVVYREAATPGAASPAPTAAPPAPHWTRRIDPDPVLLFRYSALTFNGHRIHYDQPYVTKVEGYPGLIVHGPLIATLLLHELVARHPAADVATFAFRAVKPIFDIAPFFVCGSLEGKSAQLFARDEDGNLCMEASATLR